MGAVLGLLFSIFLIFTVLIHELGHALATHRMGGHCEKILLWPLVRGQCMTSPFLPLIPSHSRTSPTTPPYTSSNATPSSHPYSWAGEPCLGFPSDEHFRICTTHASTIM